MSFSDSFVTYWSDTDIALYCAESPVVFFHICINSVEGIIEFRVLQKPSFSEASYDFYFWEKSVDLSPREEQETLWQKLYVTRITGF